ncbi:Septum formation inhibitor MinC [Beggiatoa sp. PS]|nr:Septum formation inhibitor MinC [Beggiatoa sp. PS]
MAEKISKAPGFFQQAPVIIDLHAVHDDNTIKLAELVRLLRNHGLIPVAIRGGNPQQNETAVSLNLGLLLDSKTVRTSRALEPELATTAPSPPKIITQQIRSGQQVVALEGDLIVLAPVSHGAEVFSTTTYSYFMVLCGDALLAGVNGDNEARIFCQHLDAELISIAGQYQVNEELPLELRGKSAQIYLQDDTLKFDPL